MKSTITFIGWNKPSKWFILLLTFVFASGIGYSQVAINTDNSAPNASAMLDVKATGLGLLAPRMTLANRPAAPATGLIIYQTDANPGYYYYDGLTWQKVGRAVDHYWGLDGIDIFNTNPGNVYLGSSNADGHRLDVQQYGTGIAAVRGTDQSGSFTYAEGMLGLLNFSGNPLGLPVDVGNIGVFGHIPGIGATGAGIYGWSNDDNILNYAGVFVADGSNSNTNYAVFAKADSGAVNYAGYFDGRVNIEGNDNYDATSDLLIATVNHTISSDTRAISGISTPTDGYGYGVYGEGGWRGVYGSGNGGAYTGSTYGVYGYASGSAGTRIGVYGAAYGGTSNWAGYFAGSTYVSSDLRIATTSAATGYALSVNGKIACEEVLVQDNASWPDYVFHKDYNLMSLEELEISINENNHLPGLPPAVEVEENGFNVADMQRRVLEKVEELTLYTIEQGKLIKNQGNLIQELQREVKALKVENASLTK